MNAKVEDLADDVKNLEKDAKALARDAQAAAEEKANELSTKCAELFQSALAAAREVPTVAAARTKEVAATTDDYVHQNPWRAVAISAGVGLVLGVLFSRK
ncbi:hypothetical protein GCM10007205_12040 [Oxalicibacterium flavum]|uniref:DUF883 domain-containing protein n=2 Tax=Oxalicibacterium flavum TaxID=179467 RepID=A0A8J2XXV5_9BURK|nr:hypothetical protein GCM10007205_12040 [Oxalicibacterium flavum]